jgi:PUA domain protein
MVDSSEKTKIEEVKQEPEIISNQKWESIQKSTLKSSQEKQLRKKIIEDIPNIESLLELIWPKKANILMGKLKPHSIVYFLDDKPLFIQVDKYPITPHLRLLLEIPDLLPSCQVDEGAIKFVLGGANIMCPGVTSKGGRLPEVEKNKTVAVFAEDKEHPLAIGYTIMGKDEMVKINKGIGIEVVSYIGDNLWLIK